MNNTILKPQIKTILDTAQEKTILDDGFMKTIMSSVDNLTNIYNKPTTTNEEFRNSFNSLLDEYNTINQANMDLAINKDGER